MGGGDKRRERRDHVAMERADLGVREQHKGAHASFP